MSSSPLFRNKFFLVLLCFLIHLFLFPRFSHYSLSVSLSLKTHFSCLVFFRFLYLFYLYIAFTFTQKKFQTGQWTMIRQKCRTCHNIHTHFCRYTLSLENNSSLIGRCISSWFLLLQIQKLYKCELLQVPRKEASS